MHGGSLGLKYALIILENTTKVNGIKIITTTGSYYLPYAEKKIAIKGMIKMIIFLEWVIEEAVLIHTTHHTVTFII